mmetsp:Transcript_5578/g.10082  ORF Transcript_5578/g.10082 Transcript_5578/m.10082 type:complete len:259 (-) Transcript_5578:222-998(-)
MSPQSALTVPLAGTVGLPRRPALIARQGSTLTVAQLEMIHQSALRARWEGTLLEPDRKHARYAAKESTLTPPELSLRRSARFAPRESTMTFLAWAQPAPTARKESSPPPLATSCARTASPEPTLHKRAQKNAPSAKRASTRRSRDQRPATTVPPAPSPTTGAPSSVHFAPGASTAAKELRSASTAAKGPTATPAPLHVIRASTLRASSPRAMVTTSASIAAPENTLTSQLTSVSPAYMANTLSAASTSAWTVSQESST